MSTLIATKVERQGVNIGDVYSTMQTFMGGYLVNYFNQFGRQWQVYVEAEDSSRVKAENLNSFYVANNKGANGSAERRDEYSANLAVRNSPCALTNTAPPN